MKPRIQWGRLLRRSLALFLATLAVWALLVCSGGGSAANALRSLGQDPGFVSAALSAELGQVAEDDGPLSGLSGWARLVVDQSPLLRGNGDAVAGHLDGSAPATPDLPAGQPAQDHDDISEPPPETTAAPEDIIARTLVPTSTQGYEVSGSLYLYNRTPGAVWGADGEFFSCPRIDDLECAYTTLQAFLDAAPAGHVNVFAMLDNEEVGSGTKQGADSTLLSDALARIAAALGAESLITMTDISGIMRDCADESSLIRTVRVSEIPALYKDGVITGGMIPKVECCAEAVRRGVPKVFIIDGRVPHSIIVEMLTDEGLGTMFIK